MLKSSLIYGHFNYFSCSIVDKIAFDSEKIIEESFDGSLPAFIAAFASRKKLSSADVAEIQKMIDAYREE